MPFRSSFKKKYGKKRYSKKSRPTRYAPRRTVIKSMVNRAVSDKLSGVVETKTIPLSKGRQIIPQPIWTTAISTSPTNVWGGVFGQKPASWTSGLFSGASQYDDLDGFTVPTGPGNTQRIGDYVYMKKTVMKLNVNMEPQNDSVRPISPYRFRLIAFKPKARARNYNLASDPTQDLFLNEIGNAFGHGTQTTEGMDIHQAILNKRDYTILHDKSWMMSHPQFDTPAFQVQTVPGRNVAGKQFMPSKDITFSVPWNKKVRYSQLLQKPEDLNFSVGFLLFAQSVNHKENSELFNVSFQGTTVYQDS